MSLDFIEIEANIKEEQMGKQASERANENESIKSNKSQDSRRFVVCARVFFVPYDLRPRQPRHIFRIRSIGMGLRNNKQFIQNKRSTNHLMIQRIEHTESNERIDSAT